MKKLSHQPETAAENNFIDDIIDPSQTRNVLVSALDILSGKRVRSFLKSTIIFNFD